MAEQEPKLPVSTVTPEDLDPALRNLHVRHRIPDTVAKTFASLGYRSSEEFSLLFDTVDSLKDTAPKDLSYADADPAKLHVVKRTTIAFPLAWQHAVKLRKKDLNIETTPTLPTMKSALSGTPLRDTLEHAYALIHNGGRPPLRQQLATLPHVPGCRTGKTPLPAHQIHRPTPTTAWDTTTCNHYNAQTGLGWDTTRRGRA